MECEEVPADSPRGLLSTALRSQFVLRLSESEQYRQQCIEALAAMRRLHARLTEEEHQVVFELRHSGATWQEIADVTAMESRQAAQYRYGRSAGLIDRLDTARGRTPKA